MGCFVKLPDFGVVKPFQEWPVEEPRMRDGEEEKKVGAATPATVTLAKVTFKLAPFVAEAPPGRPEGGDMSVAYMLSVSWRVVIRRASPRNRPHAQPRLWLLG